MSDYEFPRIERRPQQGTSVLTPVERKPDLLRLAGGILILVALTATMVVVAGLVSAALWNLFLWGWELVA